MEITLWKRRKGQVQIIMYNDNRNPFITRLHNGILVPDLCDTLFSIITLMNLVHTCLFHNFFCTVYFGYKKRNTATLPHSAPRKHAFLVKTKEKAKSNKIAPRNKVALEILHHRLGHRSTR